MGTHGSRPRTWATLLSLVMVMGLLGTQAGTQRVDGRWVSRPGGVAASAVTALGPPPAQPRLIAHRGASSEAPENTVPAFVEAIESGAPGVEMDVRFTHSASSAPVLMHDATVDRTTNCTGRVTSFRTVRRLVACDAGSWFSRGYVGTPVATMYRVTKTLHDRRYRGLIGVELKVVPTPAQAALTIDRVHRFGLDRQTVFTSPIPAAIRAMVRAGWHGRTGWIFTTPDGWTTTGYTDLIVNGAVVTADRVARARASTGARITVGSARYDVALARMGADHYVVDHLDEAMVYTKVLGGLCATDLAPTPTDTAISKVN